MAEHGLLQDEASLVLAALRDMARASTSLAREGTIGELIRIYVEVSRSDRGALYRLDESRALLVLVGTWPCDDPLKNAIPSIDVRTSNTGHQMLAGGAGAFSVASTKAPPALIAAGVQHWATVPLLMRGRIVGAINIARNRDERFTARELHVADMLAEVLVTHVENTRLHEDVQRQLDETHMLLDVGRALSASLDLDGILETAVETLTRMVNASTAFVLLLEEGDAYLRGAASSNPSLREFVSTVRVGMDTTSLIARAVTERKPIFIEDVETTTEVRRDLTAHLGQKSLLAAPLLTRDRPIGVVLIDDTRNARSWTAQEIGLTELVAHQVAAAVANARLYAEVKRRNEQLAHAHQQMVERERLAALGQFAATLAHEIRNPLGVLFNSVSTLAKRTSAGSDEETVLGIIEEETRRLDRLVRELLEFARPRAPALQMCLLTPVIKGAVQAACVELVPPPTTVVIEIADMPSVQIDPFMIRQALFNLVLNGGQAAGPSGTVVVRAGMEGDERFFIEVTDDGPGISPAHTERIFEPFFTTKPMGTGLGLVIVKSIVDSHNGDLRVRTAASGHGTTVAVSLPIDASVAAALPDTS